MHVSATMQSGHPMKKLIFLSKVCLLALSLTAFGPAKSNAQGLGLITLTNYDGLPLFILGAHTNGIPDVGVVLDPAIPDLNNTNWQHTIVLIVSTNEYLGGQIHIQPGQIFILPTNVVIFPPPTIIPIFSLSPFGMITTTNWYRVSFQWQSQPRAKYRIQRSTDEINWTTFKTIVGTGNRISVGNYPTGRRLHYRVITDWPGWDFPPYPPTEITDANDLPFQHRGR
jgi:hypothetical protein